MDTKEKSMSVHWKEGKEKTPWESDREKEREREREKSKSHYIQRRELFVYICSNVLCPFCLFAYSPSDGLP